MKITGCVKWSPGYEKAMYLVELWVLLNTRYEYYCNNSKQITLIQQRFPHITYDVNGLEIIIGLQSTHFGWKLTNNQAEALSIKYKPLP